MHTITHKTTTDITFGFYSDKNSHLIVTFAFYVLSFKKKTKTGFKET
jgi:hypothetical protein